jgi:hypothetical protein
MIFKMNNSIHYKSKNNMIKFFFMLKDINFNIKKCQIICQLVMSVVT